ncbi:MAG TPA: hydroxymethylglutaryl-CoA synthase [Armatimonadota bacterium]|jgi:hydroxymethylglutaryl-CoA synthase
MAEPFPAGIAGYGVYIPRWRVSSRILAEHWGHTRGARKAPLVEKSVPGPDEDTVTMAIEAARNALSAAGLAPEKLGAVWVGTESKPYAVKPSSTIVAEAIGAGPLLSAADFEFACKAGTEALRAALGFVGARMCEYALVIGMDTAQSRPGDELEYTAAAGGGAMIIGPREEALATVDASLSFVTDTPDFYRRQHAHFPEHGRRFTGQPAYFHHSRNAAERLLSDMCAKSGDFTYAVFHQPTPAFPRQIAKQLGFTSEQIAPGVAVGDGIGNTYAGNVFLGLAATLDVAKPGDRILCVSYGSGAGSDAFAITVTELIEARRDMARSVGRYLGRRADVPDYATYLRLAGGLGEGAL